MKLGLLVAAGIVSAGSAVFAVSGDADAGTSVQLHCPSRMAATLQIVNTGGAAVDIRGTTTAAGIWSGGPVAARILDRAALKPGSEEAQVVLSPLVAWVQGSNLICGYRLTTAGYRVDAQIRTPCPATRGGCAVAGDGRAPDDFRFDYTP